MATINLNSFRAPYQQYSEYSTPIDIKQHLCYYYYIKAMNKEVLTYEHLLSQSCPHHSISTLTIINGCNKIKINYVVTMDILSNHC